ncbi:SNF-domain-containing protein [Hortaea werneckii]|nr:SNF-domain-containing protein [Hortaea werneckii]KAI7619661.1 SNF-domain-containing protein [Hortaea werneckii]KAI7630497.1 SNF-domain-containing protein [Hortaea werneckii]KAI7676510.1 SNF-domain-containing protein [Hortaea werneckii]KAI7709964.1 SNF-domain-containing protein [Hortaea werneckii]
MPIANWLKKAGSFFTSSKAKKSEDGRDQWPSRTAFLLASVGGAVGQGNIIRYPSQVFNNIGLQWFIPYLIAIFLLAIPGLILEVSIGQAYRGGTVVAFNNVNRRTRGTGLASIFVSSVVVVYFAIILVWIMIYFRHSFTSPLPWEGRTEEFYYQQVLRQVDPIKGSFENGSVQSFTSYPDLSLIGETVGWSAFTWFCVWLCMYGGVSTTGRAVYFTMGLPIIFTIILIGRCTSLENAGRGIKLYFATWNGDQLSNPDIWQTACGQVFFSTGVGFGYYIAYASFNAKYANAVQDAIILVCSNCFFETVAAFAVFGVVGYLDINPSNTERLGSFEIGFLTYPAALVEMPGANFWAVLFFLTLMLLGISSTYPMLDVIATGIMDRFGHKVSKPYISTGLVISAFLISLMYCTRFGYYLLDGVDRWINNLALVFVVWAEMSLSTTVYRYTDILGQTGKPAYFLWNAGYFGGQILGVAVGHGVSAPAGAGAGFGCFVVFTGAALLVAKTPDAEAPGLFNKNAFFKRFWFLAFYSGNQLRRDLNVIVAAGKNWNIPALWGPLLRYISSPILFIVYSFAYPEFWTLRNDPVYVFGFILAHICLVAMVVSVIAPRFFDVFVPVDRRDDGVREYAPNVTEGLLDAEAIERSESGSGDEKRSSSDRSKAEKPL